MKKHPLPAWLGCLLLIALTLIGTWRFWAPITEESGTRRILPLQRAYRSGSTLWLDFGLGDDFRLPYGDGLGALLQPDAVGREYNVIADYHARRRGSDYYDVYALSCVDGTTYLTLEQAEAQRRGMLPLRITLVVALDALVCGLVLWKNHRRKAASEEVTAPEPDPDGI